jgi:putative addiction module CopG family antidote
MRMNVILPPVLEDYIRDKVSTGEYSDANEVIRNALRLMIERNAAGRAVARKGDLIAALKSLEPELRARGIAAAALFGSVARDQAGPDSDVDVPISIDPAAPFDLFDLAGARNLLADRLGRSVDVVEKGSLKPLLRDGILAEAEPVFG